MAFTKFFQTYFEDNAVGVVAPELAELASEISNAGKYDEAIESADAAAAEVAELKDQIHSGGQAVTKLKEENNEIKSEYERLESVLEDKRSELLEISGRIQDLSDDSRELTKRINDNINDVKTIDSSLNDVEDQKKTIDILGGLISDENTLVFKGKPSVPDPRPGLRDDIANSRMAIRDALTFKGVEYTSDDLLELKQLLLLGNNDMLLEIQAKELEVQKLTKKSTELTIVVQSDLPNEMNQLENQFNSNSEKIFELEAQIKYNSDTTLPRAGSEATALMAGKAKAQARKIELEKRAENSLNPKNVDLIIEDFTKTINSNYARFSALPHSRVDSDNLTEDLNSERRELLEIQEKIHEKQTQFKLFRAALTENSAYKPAYNALAEKQKKLQELELGKGKNGKDIVVGSKEYKKEKTAIEKDIKGAKINFESLPAFKKIVEVDKLLASSQQKSNEIGQRIYNIDHRIGFEERFNLGNSQRLANHEAPLGRGDFAAEDELTRLENQLKIDTRRQQLEKMRAGLHSETTPPGYSQTPPPAYTPNPQDVQAQIDRNEYRAEKCREKADRLSAKTEFGKGAIAATVGALAIFGPLACLGAVLGPALLPLAIIAMVYGGLKLGNSLKNKSEATALEAKATNYERIAEKLENKLFDRLTGGESAQQPSDRGYLANLYDRHHSNPLLAGDRNDENNPLSGQPGWQPGRPLAVAARC